MINIIILFVLFFVLPYVLILYNLRRVVPANEAHLIQYRYGFKYYWKWLIHWDTYLEWPGWIPFLWIEVAKFNLDVFTIVFKKYTTYDSLKVNLIIDLNVYFVVKDIELISNISFDMNELEKYLQRMIELILQKVFSSKSILKVDITDFFEKSNFKLDIKEKLYKEILSSIKNVWVELKKLELIDINLS